MRNHLRNHLRNHVNTGRLLVITGRPSAGQRDTARKIQNQKDSTPERFHTRKIPHQENHEEATFPARDVRGFKLSDACNTYSLKYRLSREAARNPRRA